MQLKLDADEMSLADELGRFVTTRAPIPPSGVLCAMSVVVGPTSREGTGALSARHLSAGSFDSTSSSFEGAPIPAHLRCPCARMSTYSPLACLCLTGSRRHRGRHVLRPLYSRMWAVFGAVMAQREPLAQNCTLHLLVVSAFGRVAACMLVFRPAVESCPCRVR